MPKLPFVPGGDKKFYELLESEATNLKDTAFALTELVKDYDSLEGHAQNISDLEHQGDEIIHTIMKRLHRTFVTPLDRGDIAKLAEQIDDVVDHIEEAARDLFEFKVESPTEQAKEMAEILYRAGMELEKAVASLSQMRRKKTEILDLCVKVSALEEEADRVGRSGLMELFNDSRSTSEMMKWREVYHELEEAADSCQGAAIVIEGIVLEYA